MNERLDEINRRTAWFRDARFGMFIHWGLYAIPARGEWVRSHDRMQAQDYMAYSREFNPRRYNPAAWARAARQAGMRYAVMTAKHHEGYCLFDSALTDFKSTKSPAGRDLIREYVEAFRAEGLKVGLYYSLIDWHHPDYPQAGDQYHPLRDKPDYPKAEQNFDRYLAFMHGQVRELCSNYGKIDILWLDFSYDDMIAEKWRATELVRMARALQPDVVINNRLEVNGDNRASSLLTGNPTFFSGDFVSPEQIIPPDGILDANGNRLPCESCVTMNNHWGYCANDHEWKSAKRIIRKLVECASKSCNLLLNVGPDANGEIPPESLTILHDIGQWMRRNGESIHGCGHASLAKPEWGWYTRSGNRLFAHVLEGNFGPIAMDVPKEKVRRIRLLRDGSELKRVETWATALWPEYLFVNFGPDPIFTWNLPDDIDTVVELELIE